MTYPIFEFPHVEDALHFLAVYGNDLILEASGGGKVEFSAKEIRDAEFPSRLFSALRELRYNDAMEKPHELGLFVSIDDAGYVSITYPGLN